MSSIFDPNCTRCPLSKRPRKARLAVCVPSSGPDDADILFMGEAPGSDEEQRTEKRPNGKPFVGAAGRELNGLLRSSGLRRSRVRVSNVVRCRPPDNRKPTPPERAACMFYTLRELEAVRPKVIVALGGSALEALTGKSEVGKNRGKMLVLLPEYRSDVRVVATYHPAAYLHNAGKRGEYSTAIVEDIRMAQRVVSAQGINAKTVTSFSRPKAIKHALRILARQDELACDLEWEVLPENRRRKEPRGMWPWSKRGGRSPRPISIAISARTEDGLLAVSLPFDHDEIGRIRSIVVRKGTIYHHGTSDLTWLYSLGWKARMSGDTMLLASLLNLDTSLSLAALASMLTDIPPTWKQETEATIGVFPATSEAWKGILERNAGDAVATVLLNEALHKKVVQDNRKKVLRLYRHVLLPSAQILARTALNGVPIDQEMLKRFEKKLLELRATLVEEVGQALKLPGKFENFLSLGNEGRLAPYIQRATGKALPHTANGRLSVTNDLLLQLKGAHPAIPKALRIRKLDARESRYYRPWRWMLEQQGDGRLHSVYRLTIAETGRTSAEGEVGNTFQQMPRQANVRRVVQARKGWLIGNVDQSVIEMRVAAWLANEKQMLRFFREGTDVHKATAGYVKALDQGVTQRRYLSRLDEWIEGVSEDERYGAKAFNFGCLFGGSWKVLVRTARLNYGITLSREKAEIGHQAFFTLYPGLVPWHDTFWRDVQRGWGETPTGRRRSVQEDEEGPEGLLRKYINLPVQNLASDLALLCSAYTWELLDAEYGKHVDSIIESVGFMHDSLLTHFDGGERRAISQIVQEAWEHPPLERLRIDFDVPLVAEFKVGERWAA